MPVIVLGGGMNGLGVIRNLGRNGIDVFCVVDKEDIVAYSRYCKKCFVASGLQEGREPLKQFLKKIKNEIPEYAVLIPTSDIYALFLADLKDELREEYYTLVPKRAVIETLINKEKFYKSLIKYQIPFPITYFPETINDVEKISRKIEYPVFVRPCISQLFHLKFGRKGFIANSREELLKYYLLTLKYRIKTIFQRIISGSPNDIFISGYFNKNNEPMALFAYKRLRSWPLVLGSSSLIESIPISDVGSIKDQTLHFLRSIGYHGFFDAEFKKDPKDNIYKFLEVNARSWWQNSFPTKCGINIILSAYLDIIHDKINYEENYKIGVKWIYFLNDLRSSISAIRDNKLTIKDWLFSLKSVRDYAFFAADDPLPICMYLRISAPEALRAHFLCHP